MESGWVLVGAWRAPKIMGARRAPKIMGARRAPKIMGARPHFVGGLVISSFSSCSLELMTFRSARGDTDAKEKCRHLTKIYL